MFGATDNTITVSESRCSKVKTNSRYYIGKKEWGGKGQRTLKRMNTLKRQTKSRAVKFTDCGTFDRSVVCRVGLQSLGEQITHNIHTHTRHRILSKNGERDGLNVQFGEASLFMTKCIKYFIYDLTPKRSHGEVAHTIIIYVKDRKYNKNDHNIYRCIHTGDCLFSTRTTTAHTFFDVECVSLRPFNSINATRY